MKSSMRVRYWWVPFGELAMTRTVSNPDDFLGRSRDLWQQLLQPVPTENPRKQNLESMEEPWRLWAESRLT
jgi:hypothetical protein